MAHEIATFKQFLKDAGDDELVRRLSELKEELFRLRMQAAVAGLENPKRIGTVKKHIARLHTESARRRQGEAQ
ncbi:MAG: 50S ribosomal protein L29 [Armatimonadetes bacterium]|nr:50S ribosomal protein L29 [Armatimonadota bacterium]